jgi:ariadne-1
MEEENLSLQLIKQLEQQEEEEHKKRRERIKQNEEGIDCAICMDNLYSQPIQSLEKCGHIFHEQCMSGYFKTQIDDKKFPLTCPDGECKQELVIADLREILDKTYQNKWSDYTLNNFIETHNTDMYWCPTPDCKYAFVKADGEHRFLCPSCKQEYCLGCGVKWHKNQTCAEYKVTHTEDDNDKMFKTFVMKKNFRQCPKCKIWVSKEDGCRAMVCKCGTEFCYLCGSEGDGHECDCHEAGQSEGEGEEEENFEDEEMILEAQPKKVAQRQVSRSRSRSQEKVRYKRQGSDVSYDGGA